MTAEIIDAAQDYIDKFTQAGVDRCRINHNAVSATHCIDCGDDIPELRRVKVPGCQRCASCQGDFEKKQGR
ncbi:phage/conjugal plasmid C-4 type zinc finger protein%2C TraR family [Klebsiella oxytoca]|uniref:TraR/DksA family transcriptional regulator n=1 Tax=Klebsiella oxytoca TaxID=571 RepID=UPI0007CC4536|nr:TraR/DksA family transcriptional regulator [Klebsiella oxytoca]SAQ20595.1 phage/conjugal plasmid C-4 type zinc finger protein%2C TraR family [Klebsiella oxytoca]SAQ65285.1 phage/conjugal plasmid C-4 type zinc finger protein%2C TraR family [Klebsiella oxytoca]HAV7166552.1 TraR/DksA family transcriptional regulator [Klebsiella oxytoca]HBU7484768.1 TraR/DksA family transcriptional regulator [Klebsiella oxytoca]HBV5293384.1 TraR/DksA family transcriptional regulator [Klebsiella oxytoca]